jgi:hypothetical protein
MSVTVYRVSVWDRNGKHQGYEYFLKRIPAESAVIRAKTRRWKAEVKVYEVDTSKERIWKALTFAPHLIPHAIRPERRRSRARVGLAQLQPHCAKRLECAQLAAAFDELRRSKSAGKPDALQTLRDTSR